MLSRVECDVHYYVINIFIYKADGLLSNSAVSLKFLFFTVFSLERPEEGVKKKGLPHDGTGSTKRTK